MTCPGKDNKDEFGFKEFKGVSKRQYWGTIMAILVVGVMWAVVRQQGGSTKDDEASVKQQLLNRVQRTYPVMGTFAKTVFYGKTELSEKASDTVRDIFFKVQDACNIFNPASELSRLNASAFNKPFKCSPLLWEVLLLSRKAYKVSGGSFDVTARPLMVLWGFYRKRGDSLPSEVEIQKAMRSVGMDKVMFNDKERSVKFTVSGMSFDLGGIAKGFAVDMAAEEVLKQGVKQGVIDLGGNMFCLPEPPPGKQVYTIGIRNPMEKEQVCGLVKMKNSAVATSGNYERYVEIKGKHYTHIMNPRTGRPVEDMLSVTVVTPDAGDADFLSTSAFINGVKFAENISSKMPATSFFIIRRSAKDKSRIEIFKTGVFKE
jgi:thiamine biosynthesis lipoprotein